MTLRFPASQVAAQPDEAVELFLAAGDTRSALAIITQQMADVMPQAVAEVASGKQVGGWGGETAADRQRCIVLQLR